MRKASATTFTWSYVGIMCFAYEIISGTYDMISQDNINSVVDKSNERVTKLYN